MYCEKILHPPSHLQHHDKQQFINPGFPLTFLIEGSFFSSFQHIISLNRMLSIYFLVFDFKKKKNLKQSPLCLKKGKFNSSAPSSGLVQLVTSPILGEVIEDHLNFYRLLLIVWNICVYGR